LIELEDLASANGADPDMTAWDDAVAAGRAALNTEPDRPTLAEEALCALERIQHGDASSGSDDFDLVANALGQLRRYDAIPPAPYIDPQGEDADKQLLEVFFRQMGRGLEVHPETLLRGIWGVRAFQFASSSSRLAPADVQRIIEALDFCIGDSDSRANSSNHHRLRQRLKRMIATLPSPPAPEKGEGPTLADVDELCAEFGFHYYNDQGETLEMLRDMLSASLARWGHPPAAAPGPGENLASPPAPAEAGSGLTRQSAIHAFRSQLTKEASSRYGLTSQDAEFDAFTSGASWAWATYATATAGGFGQAPQAGEGE
jgi:hypothetical protein